MSLVWVETWRPCQHEAHFCKRRGLWLALVTLSLQLLINALLSVTVSCFSGQDTCLCSSVTEMSPEASLFSSSSSSNSTGLLGSDLDFL